MNKFTTWAKNRGLGPANVVIFALFVVSGAVLSLFPIPEEEYELLEETPEDEGPTAEEILEGLKDGTYISAKDDQGETQIYKKV